MSEAESEVAEQQKTVCTRCGNTGGRFRLRGDGWVCVPNCAVDGNRDSARSTFPFTTTHIGTDGQPIVVESMRHLRKLENAYGVHSSVYNNDSGNY